MNHLETDAGAGLAVRGESQGARRPGSDRAGRAGRCRASAAGSRQAQRRRFGFTLIELLFVMSVMMIAFVTLAQSIVASMALTRVNRESALAGDGTRQVIEMLQGRLDFEAVFEDFRPGSPTGPGNGFAVAGLEPGEGDPDGLVGEIVFPTLSTATGIELRENLDQPELGMPRDLNGDGDIDSVDHSDDYRILPVLVRVSWRGVSGERTTEVCTLISDR